MFATKGGQFVKSPFAGSTNRDKFVGSLNAGSRNVDQLVGSSFDHATNGDQKVSKKTSNLILNCCAANNPPEICAQKGRFKKTVEKWPPHNYDYTII